MADSQVRWGLEALDGAVTEPAWKTKPSWYHVSTEDKMIPPDAQRAMSKRTGSQPLAVADRIAEAANGVALATLSRAATTRAIAGRVTSGRAQRPDVARRRPQVTSGIDKAEEAMHRFAAAN
jgi:hypothetical protein